jgi:creatinine amidohydrolase/Fe(II)-dependent formamide hydrolase-like protein
MNHDIGSMAMPEFAEAMARNPWLLLPIGTTEEHGPHLPLSMEALR